MLPSLFVALATLAAQSGQPNQAQFVVPTVHDLRIKTRETHGLQHSQTVTWYFKGARERSERTIDGVASQAIPMVATITQCDVRQTVHLNIRQKDYRAFPIRMLPRHMGWGSGSLRQNAGPEVLVTINSVDTGHRRQIGGYQARELKTVITVKPSEGAITKPGKVKADSWYLDIPGLNCSDSAPRLLNTMWFGLTDSRSHDQVAYKYSGVEPTGLLVEETYLQRSDGNVIRNKTEILEVSENPLDDSLFDIPNDFSPAPEPKGRPLSVPVPAPTVVVPENVEKP